MWFLLLVFHINSRSRRIDGGRAPPSAMQYRITQPPSTLTTSLSSLYILQRINTRNYQYLLVPLSLFERTICTCRRKWVNLTNAQELHTANFYCCTNTEQKNNKIILPTVNYNTRKSAKPYVFNYCTSC